jgi:hypothetical protein
MASTNFYTNVPFPGTSRPTGTPWLPSTNSGMGSKALQDRMSILQSRIDALNSQIKSSQDYINNSGGWHTEADIASRRADMAALQDQLNSVQGDYSKVQNQYYEASGQYDKLLSGDNRDAYMAITSLFKNYGLESLSGKIFDYVKNGYGADTISILLQDTPEYKDRFIGNEARKKAGLPVLSPAEYLATESAYRQVMESAGLPKGFYDNKNDFADLIGKNVSPTEMKDRVDLAVQATTLASDAYKQALKQVGIGDGDMVAYFLDEKKAMPYLTKAAATARIGAEALQQGLSFDAGYAEGLAKAGISADQARQGYSTIANEMNTLSSLGSIYGEEWNQREAERAAFEGAASAVAKRKRLASQERGQFGGSAGTARGGLAQQGGAR